MKFLIVNASPYLRRSNTSIILNAFMSGIREASGTIELFNLSQLQINPCRGDLTCWFRTRGKCMQHDDMEKLFEPFTTADVIIFSTPVYCDGVPGQLKILIDRLIVGGDPLLELRDNHSRHPVSENTSRKKFVLISSCGLWELDNFDAMVLHMSAFCRNMGFTFSGALLRPHAFAMKNNDINDILKSAKNAGRSICQAGVMIESDLHVVSREIVSRETYIHDVNLKVNNLIH